MSVSDLINTINAAASAPPADISDAERLHLIAACNKLRGAVEVPIDSTMRIAGEVYESPALATAIEMGLIDAAANYNSSGGSFNVDQLASATSAEPLFITRLMRMLVAMGIFNEVGLNTFKSTPLADAYASGSPFRELVIHLASHNKAAALLPDYFADKGYKSPSDPRDGPFQYAMQTKEQYFEYLAARPKLQHALNVSMTITRQNRGEEWLDFYPVEERLQVNSPSDVLLVDVGGGKGHDLAHFHRKFPSIPGRLILQDQPAVIDDANDLPEAVETMSHDFFQTQPVKGAKAYFLRTVLHDWPEKEAKDILEKLREGMTESSILLISEYAVPDTNPSFHNAFLDFTMMTALSALDRTDSQFKELLEAAGFELLQIWKPEVVLPGSCSLFEAVVKR